MKTFYDAMTHIDLLWKRIFMQFNFPSLRNSQDPQGKENQSKIAFCLLQVGHMSAFTIVWWNWFELKYIDLQTNWNFCTHHLFNRPVIQSLINILRVECVMMDTVGILRGACCQPVNIIETTWSPDIIGYQKDQSDWSSVRGCPFIT